MPEMERSILREEYGKAECILEFGSGGSTLLASNLGKKIFSVESDKNWAERMEKIQGVKIHHVDIGPTKGHGHPKDKSKQHKWPEYPTSVWDRPDFEHPDIILIDGRFRVACFLVASIRIQKTTKILFDDFERKQYKIASDIFPTKLICGRLAIFDLHPNKFDFSKISILFNNLFATI